MNALTAATDILRLATVDSTNSECMRQWNAGRRDVVWVTAGEQTAGRGRERRDWVSKPGNLYASLLLPLDVPQHIVPQLSLVAALAVHETVQSFCSMKAVTLKWPNDCLVNGAKVAGILIEGISTLPRAACIGMGINVAHAPEAALYPTTCIAAHADTASNNSGTGDVDRVFDVLAANMLDWLSIWNNGRGFAEIRGSWCARSIALGEVMQVRGSTETVRGMFAGLGGNGELLLQMSDGHIEHIYAGDVMQAKEHAA